MTTGCTKVIEKMKKGFQKLENCDDYKSEEEILPAVMTYLTPAMIEEARNELNETDEVKQKTLAELRGMIEAEKNLVSPTDDIFLLAFLRSRKFNVKKAFKLLQNYWKFRKEYKKIYDVVDVETVISLLLNDFLGLLRYRDRKGCIIFIVKIGLWDTGKDTYEDVFRAATAVLVYNLQHEANHIAGYRIIFDLRGISWSHLKYFTPGNILLLVRSTQFCYPARYKGIHVLFENRMLNFIWGMIYPFLTSKLKKRIFFHGEDLKALLQFIHPSVLPEEFGGQAPTFENSQWIDIIRSEVDKTLAYRNFGYKD